MIWVIIGFVFIAFMSWLFCKAGGDADDLNEDYRRRHKDEF